MAMASSERLSSQWRATARSRDTASPMKAKRPPWARRTPSSMLDTVSFHVEPCDLEEGHGGAALHGAVVQPVLVGQVLEGLDGDAFPARVHQGAEVGEVAGQQQYRKQPPDGADQTSGRGFGVRTGA
ncbi:hypothetical protein EYF80_058474 [Liparis tanakae]|uniref:Uncharacterized protein n=1 Tax=Liparis tanakae TaxID=230148 RepID=A0A4Z2ER25_9TELE|nr:hypothetical protein EYF80_058474 [Liparis tanakae]